MKKRLISIYRELETGHRTRKTGPMERHNVQWFIEANAPIGNRKPSSWWPADSPFEVMVGAVLTQNTNWKNVEKAIANLKEAGILDPQAILKTENSKLETLIRPSGYFRQKAERLKLASRKWIEIKAKLETGDWKPSDTELRSEWLSVTGVGPETADSILLYAFNMPVFVIDAYTKRFCEHYGLFKGKTYGEYQEFFESNLPMEVYLFKEYHALIVEWAKRNKKDNVKRLKYI